jgi:hypothetical protein
MKMNVIHAGSKWYSGFNGVVDVEYNFPRVVEKEWQSDGR